jgi:hypothetical protein
MTDNKYNWYDWKSAVGVGIGLAGLGIFFYLGSLALYTLTHL